MGSLLKSLSQAVENFCSSPSPEDLKGIFLDLVKYSEKAVFLQENVPMLRMFRQLGDISYRNRMDDIWVELLRHPELLKTKDYRRACEVIGLIDRQLSSEEIVLIWPSTNIGDTTLLLSILNEFSQKFNSTYLICDPMLKSHISMFSFSSNISFNYLSKKDPLYSSVVLNVQAIEAGAAVGIHREFIPGRTMHHIHSNVCKGNYLAEKRLWLKLPPEGGFTRPNINEKSFLMGEEWLKSNGLTPSKTIVFAPFARSIKPSNYGLKEEVFILFFERIIKRFEELGFSILLNTGFGTYNKSFILENCYPQLDVATREEIFNVINAAGYLCSIRSGLCDLISMCNDTKLFVLYPEISLQNRFGMMKTFSNVLECDFKSLNTKELLNAAEKFFID